MNHEFNEGSCINCGASESAARHFRRPCSERPSSPQDDELKVPCSTCGSLFPLATARTTNGVCPPCTKRTAQLKKRIICGIYIAGALTLLIAFLSIVSGPIGTGVVMNDGAILYFERTTPEEISERTASAPGVVDFARRASNSSAANAVMPAVRSYIDAQQRDIEKQYESTGRIARLSNGTQLTILAMASDPAGTKMFRVRISSGEYANREGFMYLGTFLAQKR